MLSIGVTCNGTQAAPSSFTIPEAIPTPTPLPTPTPEPTSTPEPTATPSGSGSSREGNQPSISVQLTIAIFGHQTQWLRTAEGKILQDVYAVSPDGSIGLFIPSGTYAYDADGNPLSEISLILTDPHMKAPDSTLPDDDYVLGTYEFWPDGASFSQPISIFIFYNPSELPKAPDELSFIMYSLNELYEWYEIPSTLNMDDNMVTVSIGTLGTFALTAAAQPTKGHGDPALPFLPEGTSYLIFLTLLLPAAVLALVIYAVIRRRRMSPATVDSDS